MRASFDEVRAEYLDRESRYPAKWQRAAGSSQDVLHVTPEELEAAVAKVQQVLSEYRRLRPQNRPPEARRVHVMLDFTPWFAPADEPRTTRTTSTTRTGEMRTPHDVCNLDRPAKAGAPAGEHV